MAGVTELPQEAINKIRKGDSMCEFPIGTHVIKGDTKESEKDLTPSGTLGKITGSIVLEYEGSYRECYLVQFDGYPAETFIVKEKLIKT